MERGLGMERQRRPQTAVQYGNMTEVCLAPLQSESVWVCVPGGSANSVFGGIQMGQLRLAMLRHSKGRVGGKCDLYSTFYSSYKASDSIACMLTEQDVSLE